MKYKIIKKKVVYNWGWKYDLRECYDVKKRVLFFFWITIKSFWEKEYAESYFESLKRLHE